MELYYKDDCFIERENGNLNMYDEEHYVIFSLPETTPADVAWNLLEVLNKHYRKGIEMGKTLKTNEIKQVLHLL